MYNRARSIRQINGNCNPPSNNLLDTLKAELASYVVESNNTRFAFETGMLLVGKVGGCFIGRGLNHWLDKYAVFKNENLPYGKTTYCEPNFITATNELLHVKMAVIKTTIENLENAIVVEEGILIDSNYAYNVCLENEKLLAEQEVITYEAKKDSDTTAIDLSEQESKQAVLEYEISKQTPEKDNKLLYIGLAVGAYLFMNKDKKKK